MDATRARQFVEARLLPDEDPTLSSADVDELLLLAVTTDPEGREPDAPDWEPTYSVRGCYRAIAEGWALKYGRAVGRFDFTTDGQTFRRGQVLDHIEHQRRTYARKLQHTSPLEAQV